MVRNSKPKGFRLFLNTGRRRDEKKSYIDF